MRKMKEKPSLSVCSSTTLTDMFLWNMIYFFIKSDSKYTYTQIKNPESKNSKANNNKHILMSNFLKLKHIFLSCVSTFKGILIQKLSYFHLFQEIFFKWILAGVIKEKKSLLHVGFLKDFHSVLELKEQFWITRSS